MARGVAAKFCQIFDASSQPSATRSSLREAIFFSERLCHDQSF